MPQSARLSLLAQLPPSALSSPDDKLTSFIDFWTRMHSTTCKLVSVAMKYVECSPDGAATQRYIWEVCEWPKGNTATWTFVCWLIDGQGMWLRQFASRDDALRFFEQPPDVVMRPRDVVADDVAEGARQRRAS
ncbi:MAG: hypothetical protein JNJ46_06950 [Myxococcales bacterium]|nr:hypothetical protein [Myxococcales bacterium]